MSGLGAVVTFPELNPRRWINVSHPFATSENVLSCSFRISPHSASFLSHQKHSEANACCAIYRARGLQRWGGLKRCNAPVCVFLAISNLDVENVNLVTFTFPTCCREHCRVEERVGGGHARREGRDAVVHAVELLHQRLLHAALPRSGSLCGWGLRGSLLWDSGLRRGGARCWQRKSWRLLRLLLLLLLLQRGGGLVGRFNR